MKSAPDAPDIDPEEMLDQKAERANRNFINALRGEQFAGNDLRPWTPARKVAAQSMGMLYPLIGDEGMEQIERTGVYAGAMKDTIIYVWLCLQKDSDVMRADRKPREAYESALRWAEKGGLVDLASPEFEAAYQLFSDKMAAEMEAKSKPVEQTSKEPGSTTDPNASCDQPDGLSI